MYYDQLSIRNNCNIKLGHRFILHSSFQILMSVTVLYFVNKYVSILMGVIIVTVWKDIDWGMTAVHV